MKQNNKTIFAMLALLLVGIVAAGIVAAYRGDSDTQGPYYNEELHDQIEQAIEDRDYDLWISLREENNLPMRGRIFSVINEDNFDLFAQMHEAMEDGDLETADSIRAQLGLGQGMMRRGQGQGMHGQGMNGQNNGQGFFDADNDGNCDNLGMARGRGRT